MDETSRLIASNKVEGTPVYGREGERLGTIYNFMVDKITGQVEYAVMSYGGFLGLGQRYFPLPWRMLDYDTREGGYRIDMVDRDLERAPSFTRESEPRFSREYSRRVHDYYGLNY
nr:PRC-barrel domain-containing protein [Sphingosinicella sp. CPCC 101087]